jgi:hypothetical protein
MIIVHLSYGLTLISSCTNWREAISEKRTLKLKIPPFVLTKIFAKQLVLVVKSIFKFNDSRRKTLGGWIITYIRVGDVPRWLTHETKASEVARLALGPFILLGAGGVVAGEVEIAFRSQSLFKPISDQTGSDINWRTGEDDQRRRMNESQSKFLDETWPISQNWPDTPLF